MIKSLAQRLSRNVLVFRVTLLVLPLVLAFSFPRRKMARLVYSAYTMLPPELTVQGAKSAHRTAKILAKSPLEAALHKAMAYRLDFDCGLQLNEWGSRVDELLTRCDEALEGNVSLATDLLSQTLLVLFHPSVHQGLQASPFVDSPKLTDKILSHKSLVRLRQSPTPGSEQSQYFDSRPIRTLILTDTNFTFMEPILESWRRDTRLEIRIRNLQLERVDKSWWSIQNTLLDRIHNKSPEPPDFLLEDLEWADVVYIEWGEALAARLSGVQMNARLVLRVHRYEAFTQAPTLTNWDNVDKTIIITPYMRELLNRTVPGIEQRTSIDFAPNVVDLKRFNLPKSTVASRSVALVQWASIVKDPLWALEVLRLLHVHDKEWQLLLIGSDRRASILDQNTERYLHEFDRAAAAFGNSVKYLGHRDDLPAVMQRSGVILSSSRVEGAPVAFQEAIASGALPVVRDWPIVQEINGARSLYPANWIVETPSEAAERIIGWSQRTSSPNEEVESREWVMQNHDASVTLPRLTRAIFDL